MKAYKVFWFSSIAREGEPYKSSAIVLAPTVEAALQIAATYGKVKAVHAEDDTVIVEAKAA